MNHVVFTIGKCNSEAEYVALQAFITKFYTLRLPAGTHFICLRWNEDVLSKIPALFPTDKLVLVGFSFGGQKTIEVATALKIPINGVVLLDPVDNHNPDHPNTTGFYLPLNVKRAWCFYRAATTSPWSGALRGGPMEFHVKQYIPKPAPVDEQHGEYVWAGDTMTAIKLALA